jgi:hypothetical protein
MRLFILVLSILFLQGSSQQKEQGVLLSFKNDSKEEFKRLRVSVRGKEYIFFKVKRGATTKPILVESTYRYCYAEVITKKDTLYCQPVDFVGETLFTSGKLTINLYIFPENGKTRDLWIR